MRSAQVTIKDLAKELGISASTVSRALKDHPDISEKTKKRVQELAKKLNYKPNAIALSLRQGKSNVIGVIIPQIVHHFFSTVISGIEDVAFEYGYTVIVSQSNESVKREILSTQALISSRVDGIIISKTKKTTEYSHFKNIKDNNIPMVFFDRICPTIDTDSVIIDDYQAAYDATKYLIKSGCKAIVHFAGPRNLGISKKRMNGYKDALKDSGIEINDNFIIKADTFKQGKKAIKKIIKSGIMPDAIFSVNDMAAAGAVKGLKKKKIKIPQQVSVMGFTNGLISRMSDPPISTVEQNGYKMGAKAAKRLIERIENGNVKPTQKIVVPTKLIIRKTTF